MNLVRICDKFFMDPLDLQILIFVRAGVGVILVLCVTLLWPDRGLLFGSDSLLPPSASAQVLDPDAYGLYQVFPDHPVTISVALATLGLSGAFLVLQYQVRLAAALAFVGLVLVQHANCLIFDAEDTVLRLFCFFLIFAPVKRTVKDHNGKNLRHSRKPHYFFPAWPLRLFQIQICLIYLASAIHKSNSDEWLNGSAVYLVLRLDDMTRFPVPDFITGSWTLQALLGWGVIAFEFAFPLLVWGTRTRIPMLMIACLFHLGSDYAMNLHLFHPLMMIGLLTFVRLEELHAICITPMRLAKTVKLFVARCK